MADSAKKQLEYYGSVKGMPLDILSQRLSKAETDVRELQAEKKRREEFTSTELLAERLHKLLHFGTDCDFYYSDWPLPAGCRAEFHEWARQIEDWYADDAGRKAGDRPLGGLIAVLERARFGRN